LYARAARRGAGGGGVPSSTALVERSAPSTFPERGSTLGRYVVLAELGAGGMGRVLAAYDAELDRRVALKLLHPGARGSGSKVEEHTVRLDRAGHARNLDRELLLAEARAMARLSHPNLVAVFEVGEVGDAVFLAMEHVTGATLDGWLAERPRSLGEILRVFIEIARGLAAAHAAGLVHGDVKPSNVLVEPNRRVRVIDFGLARAGVEQLERHPPVELGVVGREHPAHAAGPQLGQDDVAAERAAALGEGRRCAALHERRRAWHTAAARAKGHRPARARTIAAWTAPTRRGSRSAIARSCSTACGWW
jgi:eukaryotic-like serine/threonine-protein kinase